MVRRIPSDDEVGDEIGFVAGESTSEGGSILQVSGLQAPQIEENSSPPTREQARILSKSVFAITHSMREPHVYPFAMRSKISSVHDAHPHLGLIGNSVGSTARKEGGEVLGCVGCEEGLGVVGSTGDSSSLGKH